MPDEEPVLLDLGELPGLALRPVAMRRLVINLLANARRHGAGQIVLHTEAREDAIVLAVRDHGPGIPEEALAGITQPFARLGSARSGKPGAGLGLAIALRVAQLPRRPVAARKSRRGRLRGPARDAGLTQAR